ncbi:hypothetical protein FRB93_013186 [Tulasnella sp. JGI-2019a]|nr:hypothetical protein FRB93_013186 [Tulasnella sp. JGI-2019a]
MSVTVMPPMLKGSRLHDAYPAHPANLQLSDIDSAFPLQEYIAHLVQQDPHNVESIVSIPGTRTSAREGDGLGLGVEEKDSGVDEACWIYEQLRRLAQDLTHPLITALQTECTRETCPEMKAGEWLYLCVAHGTGTSGTMEQCCAIDYITHTLDSATALLNSPRPFPSRLQIPAASTRHFGSLARRLSRIFAHAYHHHREAFEQSEAESSLYARFLLIANKFELVPAEFLFIPGGNNDTNDSSQQHPSVPQPQTISVESALPASSSAFQTSNVSSGYAARQLSEDHNLDLNSASLPTSEEEHENENSEFMGNMSREDRSRYGNMTIKSPGGVGGMPESDRRTILNRSRTDTMYMRDFDLSEFASAAGDAMAMVKAEEQQPESQPHPHEANVEEDPAAVPHEEDDLSLGEDGYEEVERVPEAAEVPEDAKNEDEDEDEDDGHHIEEDENSADEAAAVPLPISTTDNEFGTGAQEPEPTPTVGGPKDEIVTLLVDPHPDAPAVEDVDKALDTLVRPTETAAPIDKPARVADEGVRQEESHGGDEEEGPRVPLEPGEVRAVSAHLGLASEGGESGERSPEAEVSWADPVPTAHEHDEEGEADATQKHEA